MSSRTYPSRGLHGDIVHRLGRRIVGGEVASGDALPNEADFAVELEVSRTVLREAVKVLAAKGLLEVGPRRGMRVRPRDEWNLLDPDVLNWRLDGDLDAKFFHDLAEVRRIMEPAAARLAAQHATADEVATLHAAYLEMLRAVDDAGAYIDADIRFHDSIVRACHNELLAEMVKAISAALRASRALTSRLAGSSADAMELHLRVLDAVSRHDAPAAEAAMREHVERTADDVERALQAPRRRRERGRQRGS
jgi:GntR family galactonate operon transcriptional repressor